MAVCAGPAAAGTLIDVSPDADEAAGPQVAIGGEGPATVIWHAHARLGAYNLRTRQVGADGALGAVHTLVGGATPGRGAGGARVAAGPDGAATVTWYRNSDGVAHRVHARRIATDGTLGEVLDLSAPGRDGWFPHLGIGPDGVATVAWERNDGVVDRVQARRVAPDGTLGDVLDLSPPGEPASFPQIAVSPDGAATVIWSSHEGPAPRVQAVRIAPDGTLGDVQDVSAPGVNSLTPRVAAAPDGSATVTWARVDGAYSRVQARRIGPDGTLGDVLDLSPSDADGAAPRLAVGGDGVATVAWLRPAGSAASVQARQIDPDGTLGDVLDLSTPSREQGTPEVAAGPEGDVTVTWAGGDQYGYGRPVQAVRLNADGTHSDLLDLSPYGFSPDLALWPDGTATFVWQSSRVQAVREDFAPAEPAPPEASTPSIAATRRGGGGPSPRDRCLAPAGEVSGRSLGPVWLGQSRARARAKLSAFRRVRAGMDEICLRGGGRLQVAYKAGRVALALTSSPRYAIRGVKHHTRVRTLRRLLRGEHSYRIGKNRWYVVRAKGGRLVFKTHKGLVSALGIAEPTPFRSRHGGKRFLSLIGR